MAKTPTEIHPPRTNGQVPRLSEHQPLSAVERMLLEGIAARGREISERWVLPYNQDVAAIDALIEREHGLPPGALGQTHRVNLDTMLVECIFVVPEVAE